MNISHIITITQIEEVMKGISCLQVAPGSKTERYSWLSTLLISIKYRTLPRKEKTLVRSYVQKVTGYSAIQLKRLLKKYRNGSLQWVPWQKKCFTQKYSSADIALLHTVDEAHQLAGPATRTILKREYEVFQKQEYKQIAQISASHIYNLRKRPQYLRMGKVFHETKATNLSLGKRIKPRPQGRVGFLRVDSVHQGDLDGKKGVYYVNVVDEVTQSEFVFCVAGISESFLRGVLASLVEIVPFTIINFHSDNGSEYINRVVADILQSLQIQQTRSRPRRHNDNGLVETKNGAIIRKVFGYAHIPATEENARLLNEFCMQWLNPYLNFHRPCGFATSTFDRKGKEKKVYLTYITPYMKWKSLPDATQYLRHGTTFQELDAFALKESDTEFVLKMNQAKATMMLKLQL